MIEHPIKIVVFDMRKQPATADMQGADLAIAIDGGKARVVKNRMGMPDQEANSVSRAIRLALGLQDAPGGWERDMRKLQAPPPGMPPAPDLHEEDEPKTGMDRWIRSDEDVWP